MYAVNRNGSYISIHIFCNIALKMLDGSAKKSYKKTYALNLDIILVTFLVMFSIFFIFSKLAFAYKTFAFPQKTLSSLAKRLRSSKKLRSLAKVEFF